MPPKKVVDPKQVTKPVSNFFKPLTKLENDARLAAIEVAILNERIIRETDEEKRKELASRILDAGMIATINNDNATRHDIVSAVENVIHELGNNVTTRTIQITRVKKNYKKRPMEWREIAIHFQQNVGIDKTIAVYKLLEINSSVQYWAVILGRWVKDLAKDDNDVKFKRTSVIGKFLDKALADVVRNYFKHGVPISDLILRSTLMQLMETHNRHDLLERCNPEDPRNIPDNKHWLLRLGQSWCFRFYRRWNFKSRVPTTKMRSDVPADYEAKKKDLFIFFRKLLVTTTYLMS